MPKIVDRAAMQQRILDAAFRCFAQTGFQASKMSDIARFAGLAKGTLYLYFDSKEALTTALVQQQFARFETLLQLPPPADLTGLMDRMRRALQQGHAEGDDLRLFLQVLAPGLADPTLRAAFGNFFNQLGQSYAADLAALQARGAIHPSLDPNPLGRALAAMLDGLLLHQMLFDPPEPGWQAISASALQLFEMALRPPS